MGIRPLLFVPCFFYKNVYSKALEKKMLEFLILNFVMLINNHAGISFIPQGSPPAVFHSIKELALEIRARHFLVAISRIIDRINHG